MQHKHHLRKKSLALVVSAVSTMLAGGVSTSAIAQDDTLEEIVVTGSRIVRRDLSAPSPIVTIGTEEIENSAATSVEYVLNQMPQFVPAATEFTNGIQTTASNSPGAATLNLRGMGTNRNLVLINGKRGQPANASLTVDINTIPSSAIQNVEVITGGASAVYGPDAMAGVVNFILKTDFEGLEFDYQMGETAEGDGGDERFSMLMGVNSADGRGNIMVGIDWTKRQKIMQKDRDFFVNGWKDTSNPGGQFMAPSAFAGNANRNPASQEAMDALFPGVAPGTVGTATDIYFNADGSPFIVAGGLGYNGPINDFSDGCGDYCGMKILDNGNLDSTGRVLGSVLRTPLERHSVFVRGNYDVTDNVSAFMQMNYANIDVLTTGGVPPAITVWQAPLVPRDGRALPAVLETLLDSRADPDAGWPLFHVLGYNGNIQASNVSNVWQFQLGLEGDLRDGDWSWEAYGSRGDTFIEVTNNRMPGLARYQSLVYAPNFGKVTRYSPGTVNGVGAGSGYSLTCTSGLPVFEKFTPSADCLDSIDTKLVHRTRLTQEILEANLQGGLGDWFELPAGEVRFALGASYRGNTYEYNPGNPSGDIRDNPVGLFASAPTAGKISVGEFYGELLVPVLDGLNLELGYRYSDFSTAGGQDTYKSMFTWDAFDTGVTFRGGYQFATRAPNIAELFTAPTQQVVFHPDQDNCSVTTRAAWGNVPGNPDRAKVIDLCRAIIGNSTSGFDEQTYSITGIDGPEGFHRQNPPFFPLEIAILQGNPNVGPEEGETYSFGAVITDPFGIEGLTVTADYYDISLEGAISPVSVQIVYNNCFNFDGASNPTYDINNGACQRIRRNAVTGDRSQVDTPFDNLGTQETKGIDMNVNYSMDIGPGTLSMNSNMNFLDTYEYEPAPGAGIIDAKGTLDRGGLFDYQALTRFNYFWNNFNVGLSWRHLADAESAAKAQSPTTTVQGPGSYDVFNLNGGWNFGENYSLRFGVDNLFDEDPELTTADPGVDSNSNVTSAGLYDLLGRRYYIGVKASF
ncbi:MAG: TonB-dependent receptor [Gammaproteobacteria bacterium]|nr:TonB-dependent receptor [Gammaproteobacteria bacterium]